MMPLSRIILVPSKVFCEFIHSHSSIVIMLPVVSVLIMMIFVMMFNVGFGLVGIMFWLSSKIT